MNCGIRVTQKVSSGSEKKQDINKMHAGGPATLIKTVDTLPAKTKAGRPKNTSVIVQYWEDSRDNTH